MTIGSSAACALIDQVLANRFFPDAIRLAGTFKPGPRDVSKHPG